MNIGLHRRWYRWRWSWQGQCDELGPRTLLWPARLATPLVHEIGVDAMSQCDCRYRCAWLRAFAHNHCLEFVAVTAPRGKLGVFHDVHLNSWWTPSWPWTDTDSICVGWTLTISLHRSQSTKVQAVKAAEPKKPKCVRANGSSPNGPQTGSCRRKTQNNRRAMRSNRSFAAECWSPPTLGRNEYTLCRHPVIQAIALA